MFNRLRGFVNRLFGRQPPPELPPEPTPVQPVFQEPPPLPPQPTQEEYGDITIVDAFGNEYTQSYEDWYADTLLNRDQLAAKYGFRLETVEIVYLLIEAGVDWDWDQWRRDYEATNG